MRMVTRARTTPHHSSPRAEPHPSPAHPPRPARPAAPRNSPQGQPVGARPDAPDRDRDGIGIVRIPRRRNQQAPRLLKRSRRAMPGGFGPTTRGSSKTIGQCRRVPQRAYRKSYLGTSPTPPDTSSKRRHRGSRRTSDRDRPGRDAGAVLLRHHGVDGGPRYRRCRLKRLTRSAWRTSSR